MVDLKSTILLMHELICRAGYESQKGMSERSGLIPCTDSISRDGPDCPYM